jgi:hypothetical protein
MDIELKDVCEGLIEGACSSKVPKASSAVSGFRVGPVLCTCTLDHVCCIRGLKELKIMYIYYFYNLFSSMIRCLKGIVSKLTVKFWMCQKCGRMKDYNKKITTNIVE